MKINKVYCFGEWILQEHHRCASLPTEQTKRFLQILKKKAANHCSKKNVTVSKARKDKSNLDAKHEKEK
jgi:hypothetical protein